MFIPDKASTSRAFLLLCKLGDFVPCPFLYIYDLCPHVAFASSTMLKVYLFSLFVPLTNNLLPEDYICQITVWCNVYIMYVLSGVTMYSVVKLKHLIRNSW